MEIKRGDRMVTLREERANNVHTINVVFGVRRWGEPLRLRRGGSFNHIVVLFSLDNLKDGPLSPRAIVKMR